MSFDKFYEESDKSRRRWWKILGLALLLLIGLWAVRIFIFPESIHIPMLVETPVVDGFSMDNPEAVRRVDELCASLPKPERFTFDGKNPPQNYANASSIVYNFNSNRQPEEIMPFFIVWFNENGWKSIAADGSMFRKGKQTVSIEAYAPFHTLVGYKIQCLESE